MQYHLDTIPVWKAMEADSNCPICWLLACCERDETERALGGSVMEPDERVRINSTGICAHHHKLLYDRNNRLGHSLLMDTHALEFEDRLEKISIHVGKQGFLYRRKTDNCCKQVSDAVKQLSSGCVLCENIDSNMKRYKYSFVHLWHKDESFRRKWNESKGMCVLHTSEILEMAADVLHGKENYEFAYEMLEKLKIELRNDEKDLKWFTLKYDYRNHDKPWGNSKDAPERMANRLRKHTIGQMLIDESK